MRGIRGRASRQVPPQHLGLNPRDLMGLHEGPSLSVQPRLPGTVVGEASIGCYRICGKVTADAERKVEKATDFRNASAGRGDEGMRDGVNRQCDPVLYADLAHQLGDVGLNGALLDAEGGADLLVGAPGDE